MPHGVKVDEQRFPDDSWEDIAQRMAIQPAIWWHNGQPMVDEEGHPDVALAVELGGRTFRHLYGLRTQAR